MGMARPKQQAPAIRGWDRSAARAASALPVAGAFLVGLSLALPHPSGGNVPALITIAVAMAVFGILCYLAADRIPIAGSHAILAVSAVLTGVLIYESGIAAGQYGSIFVWSTLISAYFFPRRVAIAHLGWILVVYGTTLTVVASTAGYSPVTRWLTTAMALGVVMGLTSEIVKRRSRADGRARHFFDLSQDMLCTMDTSGRCIETNDAWTEQLGYGGREMEGKRLLGLTHPDDRGHATEQALRLFSGQGTGELETRVEAKDGTWHWLRTSYAFAPDESLVYARSTDVTELKTIAAEREALLAEVQSMARSDPLTGLPNRRALAEALPRELLRARRSRAPLCVAVLDLDHFKAYNDANGHLAGDGLLRECAIAWDQQIRGVDTIVRFGGEEFLLVLPDTAPEEALEILERLRAVVPDGQTCSAGLATWDFTETENELLDRADKALYAAKENGRDRTMQVL
jgi:diguanylate cyclase (GGDEF)-like protein/PAS domain S-box-containing protein